MKTFKIKRNPDLKVASSIVPILDSDFCYIPIYPNYEVQVKENQTVFKSQCIMLENNQKITSPISGIVRGVKEVLTIAPIARIKNDFKEKEINNKGINKNFSTYKFKDLESLFKKYYVPVLDELLEPVTFNKDIDILIINTIDDEPYVANNNILIMNKLEDLLETIDVLSIILNVKETYITVNAVETDLIDSLMKIIGTYPNIKLKLIDNFYPLNLTEKFKKNSNLKIINIVTLNAIDYVLKKEKNISEKLITITGEYASKKEVLLVKLGTDLSNIIKEYLPKEKKEKIQVIVNGLMTGKELINLNLIVTPNLKSIHIIEEIELIQKSCINCGACVRVCPVKNNPKFVKDYPQDKMSINHREKCITCNSCSYVCPANINFKEIMEKERNNENK